jgi:anti-sigma regulatory factor (Ser/Thr protein kinase)
VVASSNPWDHVSVQQFDAVPTSVGDARRHAADRLRTWGLDDLVDTATLLVSELATNAVQASRPARGQTAHGPHGGAADQQERVALRLTCTDTNLVVEMWDGSDRKPVRTSQDLAAESGRGLLLVETLSCDWGYYRPRTGGKVVWCALTLARSPFSPVDGSPWPLPRRSPEAAAQPSAPVEMSDDVALLRHVLDCLRGLDNWHLSDPSADRKAAEAPNPNSMQRNG